MPNLLLADLHLTDTPLEEYRWGVFDWINDVLLETYNFDNIIILGDLTEKKDNHSSKLVNRLTSELNHLANKQPLIILRGNHDCIDPEWPFFLFMQNNPYIDYFYRPARTSRGIYLPHTKDPLNEWCEILAQDLRGVDYIFMHQTVKGAKGSNGVSLEGVDGSILSNFSGDIFSGDIHTPQSVGRVTYVGSPYPVYFGDNFVGGAIVLQDDKSWERLTYNTIRRVNLELDLTKNTGFHFTAREGDQFKVTMLVNRSDSDKFDQYKKIIKEGILQHKGVVVSMELKLNEEKSRMVAKRKLKVADPENILKQFAKAEGLDEFYLNKGKEFLNV
jgi:hypothetical protein